MISRVTETGTNSEAKISSPVTLLIMVVTERIVVIDSIFVASSIFHKSWKSLNVKIERGFLYSSGKRHFHLLIFEESELAEFIIAFLVSGVIRTISVFAERREFEVMEPEANILPFTSRRAEIVPVAIPTPAPVTSIRVFAGV